MIDQFECQVCKYKIIKNYKYAVATTTVTDDVTTTNYIWTCAQCGQIYSELVPPVIVLTSKFQDTRDSLFGK